MLVGLDDSEIAFFWDTHYIKMENIKGRKQPFSRKKVDLFSIALVTWSEKISKEYQNRKYHREKAGEYQNCPS